MPQDLIARLRRLDSCAVSDAIDKLRHLAVTSCVVTGVPQQAGAGRIAGTAITLRLGTDEVVAGPPRHLGTLAVEAGGPDNVIVVEQRTGLDAGCWGGLLSLAAKVRGIAGVVADGPVRDIDEARDRDFPVFARALTSRTARGRIVEKGTNVPVTMWDTEVSPGDYVLADNSAVVFIRACEIEMILKAAEQIAARETEMADALLAGVPASQVMSGAYEDLLKQG